MTDILLIVFTISLLYISIAHRLLTYVKILALQGLILSGMALIQLRGMNTVNLVVILLETVAFKTIALPLFLNYVITRNNITREADPYLPNFASLLIITLIIAFTFVLSNVMPDLYLEKMFFIVVLSALLTGLYIILTRRKIITHVMGYLVIENGVFLLSFAIGEDIPMLVNLGILLDLFASVFVLGIFVNKIVDVLKDVDIDALKNLKD